MDKRLKIPARAWTPAAVRPAAPTQPVSGGFIAGFTLANIGAAFAFAPLLNILVPLRAQAIDPPHKALLLSTLLFWGALTAGIANVAFGALSDRTRSRLGRRRPWIFAGLIGSLACYLLIAAAPGRFTLLAAIIGFQLCFNALYAPLVAVFPDQVPDRQKGLVSGWMSIGYPVGAGIGALVVGRMLGGAAASYAVIALALTATVAPFAARLRDGAVKPPVRTSPGAERPAGRSAPLRAYRDFAFAWTARLMLQTAFFMASAYGLFYLEDVVHYDRAVAGGRAEEGFATLVFACTLANILASVCAGAVSDRTGRRKVFIVFAAIVVAAGMLCASSAPSWPFPVAVWAMLGGGMGVFMSIEGALIAQVLPSAEDVGRDLGLMNLGNTLPQCIAPALAYVLLRAPHPDYRAFFASGAAFALLGAAAILPVRRAR